MPPSNRLARVAALLEMLLAFVFVHATFRAIKHFTPWGRWEGSAHLNFTPGLVMILFTLCILSIRRKSFPTFGLTLANWDQGLKIGLVWGLLLVAGAAVRQSHRPCPRLDSVAECQADGGFQMPPGTLGAVVFLGRLLRQQVGLLGRVPATMGLAVVVGAFCVPLVIALPYGQKSHAARR